MAVENLKALLECLVFLSEEPVTLQRLHEVVPDAGREAVASALKELEREYESSGRGILLKEVAGGYQFRSRPEFGRYVRLLKLTQPARISRPAMETLAVIAYKQPTLRSEVERLRGVDVGGILKTLLERDLIRIVGRKALPGRPILYGTTRRFLEVFGLKDLTELPTLEELSQWTGDIVDEPSETS